MNQISPRQVRDVMLAIPSWARALPTIADDTPFPDCGLDSLALLELVSELQRVYGMEIPDDDVEKITTIANTANYLNQHLS
jgi:acyl carrier protein